MHHFRTNPPSRAVAPRRALLPSEGYLRRTHQASSALEALERHVRKSDASVSAIGRLIANDPRLIIDLRAGREPGARITAKIASFLKQQEAFHA